MTPADDSTHGRGFERREDETGAVVDIHEPIYREKAEPRDGYEPVPLWLMFAALALMGVMGWYLGMYSGGFRADVYDENALLKGGLKLAEEPAAKPVDPMVLGKRVFNNCMACHQADGRGVAGNYPPLDGSRFVSGRPDVLAALLLHGLQGQVTVEGETFNGVMPSWSHLDDDQIAAVMTYVRSSWSNQAPAVAPEVVAAVRSYTEDRREAFRVTELDDFANEFELPADVKAADAAPAADDSEG
jgi:mono/diheme cytochrome c family protein